MLVVFCFDRRRFSLRLFLGQNLLAFQLCVLFFFYFYYFVCRKFLTEFTQRADSVNILHVQIARNEKNTLGLPYLGQLFAFGWRAWAAATTTMPAGTDWTCSSWPCLWVASSHCYSNRSNKCGTGRQACLQS